MSSVWKFVKVFLLVLVIAGTASALVLGITVIKYMDDVSDLDIENFSVNLTSSLYYINKDGKEIEAKKLSGVENRLWVGGDKIPKSLKDAFVAIEDERYYKHNGVDIPRTAKATLEYLFKDKSSFGGSTITQQLVKNITGEKDVSPSRKVKEIARAMKLDKTLGKEKVLEMYMNIIYLGNRCNGVQAASHKYFAKDVSELTIAESACIASITQNPSKWQPLKYPENNKKRRDVVLSKMLELGYINQTEHDEAKDTELVFATDEISVDEEVNSYFEDHVINEVINDLAEQKGYSKEVASRLIYTAGFKIYMTVDTGIQSIMEDVYEDPNMFPKKPPANPKVKDSKEYPQSAMCIIDPHTGQVKGVVGGIGEKKDNRVLNRATQSKRQPGSTIKPLSVYAPAVELGLISPGSVVVDEAIDINGWTPKNYYKGFKGPVTVRYAVEQSANIPAVKILQEAGLDYSFSFMKNKFNIASIVASKEINGKIYSDKGLSALALGGLTNGITLEEISSAYGTFINNGVQYDSYAYTKVLDPDGNVVLENNPEPKQIMSETTAYIMNYLLGNVVKNGTGTAAKLPNGMQTYGKTGTTNDDIDRWFLGYTPYYVGSVWYGYDKPSSVAFLSSNPTVKIWKAVMSKIHDGLEPAPLDIPDNVQNAKICVYSGMLPNEYCSKIDEPKVSSELFISGQEPSSYCDLHDADSITPVEIPEEPPIVTPPNGITPPETSPSPEVSPSVNPESTPSPSPGTDSDSEYGEVMPAA